MKLRNPSGRVVGMNQRLYDYHKNQEGWTKVEEEAPKGVSKFPKEKGAGWYELSDGSSVRGEENAQTKQAELDG